MKLCLSRYGLELDPQNEVEIAFLEEVLGLRAHGDSVPLRRIGDYGFFLSAKRTAQ